MEKNFELDLDDLLQLRKELFYIINLRKKSLNDYDESFVELIEADIDFDEAIYLKVCNLIKQKCIFK